MGFRSTGVADRCRYTVCGTRQRALATRFPRFICSVDHPDPRGLPHLHSGDSGPAPLPESSPKSPLFDLRAVGFWIGFFETLIIF